MTKKLEIRVEEDTTPYGKHDGYSVCLYADDECVFATPYVTKADAEDAAKKKRSLLGLEKLYRITFTYVHNGDVVHLVAFGTLMEASAWANANAPKGCTKIVVEEA